VAVLTLLAEAVALLGERSTATFTDEGFTVCSSLVVRTHGQVAVTRGS
jgi:hypothetical protein